MNWFERPKPKRDRISSAWKKDYKNSDFGRRYGWWLCLDGDRVADLDYRFWDESSQFWHVYHIFSFSSRFKEVGLDPDHWSLDRVSLQSRFAPQFSEKGILMSEFSNDLVAVRGVHIPEEVFKNAYGEAQAARDRISFSEAKIWSKAKPRPKSEGRSR